MSIHASRVTKTIPIPFDAPHEATIRKLSGKHLQKAADANIAAIFAAVQDRGGAAVTKEMQSLFERPKPEAGDTAVAAIAALKADPLNGYDKHTLVRAGLQAWTYTDVPLTPEAIEDLDSEAVDYFATEIMRLTKPALYQTAEEQGDAAKNG